MWVFVPQDVTGSTINCLPWRWRVYRYSVALWLCRIPEKPSFDHPHWTHVWSDWVDYPMSSGQFRAWAAATKAELISRIPSSWGRWRKMTYYIEQDEVGYQVQGCPDRDYMLDVYDSVTYKQGC